MKSALSALDCYIKSRSFSMNSFIILMYKS